MSEQISKSAEVNGSEPFAEARGSNARCRWCDRNDRPLDAMAIMSWKMSYGGYTGVCLECYNDPEAERRYHQRMLAQSNVKLCREAGQKDER